MNNIIEIHNLYKVYNERSVLYDLSFSIPERCIFGFLGPNGAGKSTTIRIILGLVIPDAGEIINKGANTFLRVDSEDAGLLDIEASLDLATDDATLNITDAISINTWSHIVLTYEDDDDDEITIYINGINKGISADGDGAPLDQRPPEAGMASGSVQSSPGAATD